MRTDYELDLEDTVRSVVNSFMDSETLFTALDVSNEVKKTMPTARHKDVRNEVRRLFAEVIEPAGWARSEIDVKLENGDVVQALLYHPLSASWSLDERYDDQKRSQTSAKTTVAKADLDVCDGFVRIDAMPPNQAYVDLASDKDYTVATTVDRGNVVQTTVLPPTTVPVDLHVPSNVVKLSDCKLYDRIRVTGDVAELLCLRNGFG